jgi:hypothetical protein
MYSLGRYLARAFSLPDNGSAKRENPKVVVRFKKKILSNEKCVHTLPIYIY